MITIEQAQKLIEKEKKVYSPTDKKRLVVPAYGFSGAIDAKRVDWLPPTYEAKEYDVKGFEFRGRGDSSLTTNKPTINKNSIRNMWGERIASSK